jgi:hypothetical protein
MHNYTDLYIYHDKTTVGGITIHNDLESRLDLFNSSTAFLQQPKTIKEIKNVINSEIKWFKKQKKLFKYEQILFNQCESLLLKLNCFSSNLIVSDIFYNKN